MGHVFFASYASVDNPLDEDDVGQLGRVVKKIRQRVRARLGGGAVEEIGFLAQNSIQTADDWKETLGEALQQSRVLVCFCSPSLYYSAWCAREHAVFRKRLELAGAAFSERVIIPVIWEPPRATFPMPEALSKYQAKNDAYPRNYRETGLATLSRLKAQEDDYIATIEQLAETICLAIEGKAPLPSLPQLPAFEELPKAFDNPGKYGVGIAVLQQDGTQWQPVKHEGSIARFVEGICMRLNIPWRDIPTVDLPAEIARARVEREAIILITDETSAQSPYWRDVLQNVDAMPDAEWALLYGYAPTANVGAPAVAVLAPPALAPSDNVVAETVVKTLVPNSLARNITFAAYPLSSMDTLKKRLEETIVRVRSALINADKAQKAESSALSQSASAAGISTATLSIVSGPGGGMS